MEILRIGKYVKLKTALYFWRWKIGTKFIDGKKKRYIYLRATKKEKLYMFNKMRINNCYGKFGKNE